MEIWGGLWKAGQVGGCTSEPGVPEEMVWFNPLGRWWRPQLVVLRTSRSQHPLLMPVHLSSAFQNPASRTCFEN